MNKNVSRKENAPFKVVTHSLVVRRLIACGVVAVACIAAGIFAFGKLAQRTTTSAVASTSEESVVADAGSDVTDSLESAEDVITDYYKALAGRDSKSLRNGGFDAAANASEMGWLSTMNYSVSFNHGPDATSMPASAGMYAGNDIYQISSFFVSPPSDAIHSDVTGVTGYAGWIYFDSVAEKWVIVDPTIPTATQSPEASTTSVTSEDGLVTVNATSRGAYENPWWAHMTESLTVTSTSTTYDVSLTSASMDDGVTIVVPDSLNNTTVRNASVSGAYMIYRGETSGFSASRIGQQAQSLNGSIVPMKIQTPTQDITPMFAIGDGDIKSASEAADAERRKSLGISSGSDDSSNSDADGSDSK